MDINTKVVRVDELKLVLDRLHLLKIRGMAPRPIVWSDSSDMNSLDLFDDVYTVEEVINNLQTTSKDISQDLVERIITLEEENEELKKELLRLKVIGTLLFVGE